ncbi:hypothetical protein RHS04_02046 [Rhizoctonia solani]|uniref:Uncharacterized protein n=1 Tax=Rhizoctonia solani TaxID=456999 RepID=A0A8H7LJE6_9AGAM|nr:hypothetical protein RHS04_02046 [Rhizoctonia solani]
MEPRGSTPKEEIEAGRKAKAFAADSVSAGGIIGNNDRSPKPDGKHTSFSTEQDNLGPKVDLGALRSRRGNASPEKWALEMTAMAVLTSSRELPKVKNATPHPPTIMIHSHHRSKDDPERRARVLSRILDPEYSGQSPNAFSSSFRARSPSLPQASVFVDRYGEQHDPDFRPFGSYPAVTPMDEPRAWPWFDGDDDDDDEPRSMSRGPTSFPSGRMAYSTASSSYHSSVSSGSAPASGGSKYVYGSRSRSISALPTPPLELDRPMPANFESHSGRHISPPAHIPRSSLFPWTPAQRAVRVQHEVNKRNVMPPPLFLEEEPEEAPLTLVDSQYVPGYGHFSTPPATTTEQSQSHPHPQPNTAPHTEHKCRIHMRTGRARAHTAPSPTTAQTPEEDEDDPNVPNSPSSSHSFRQSIYSLGLRTKLGLHHMKDRVRRASGAAKRPLSL